MLAISGMAYGCQVSLCSVALQRDGNSQMLGFLSSTHHYMHNPNLCAPNKLPLFTSLQEKTTPVAVVVNKMNEFMSQRQNLEVVFLGVQN
jgi:hypothetical protein